MGTSRAERFERYVSLIAQELGHADRVQPFGSYCTGLLLPVARKSIEPIAAQLAPRNVRSEHQRLHHFVADASWSDQAVLSAVRAQVMHCAHKHLGAPEALILDDTGFPKQGTHSVGVARQYCGQLGKQDNCQVAVSVSIANEQFSLPIAYRLYLPKEWAEDAARRAKAKVPESVQFATKPAIAWELIEQAQRAGPVPQLVLMDAGYGIDTAFRERLSDQGFQYVAGITSVVSLWPQGQGPLPAKSWSGRGRRPRLLRRDEQHQPMSAKAIAMSLAQTKLRTVQWREGTNQALRSRFAALRVRVAYRDYWRSELPPEEWLLIEWPTGQVEPTKYFLSTLPASTSLKELVRLAKLRWRIERDYQELKQELGLGHFEGRSWRGFHHHASLCIASYGFLITERLSAPKKTLQYPIPGEISSLPEGFRPRGSPARPAARSRLDRHDSPRTRRGADRAA